MRNCPCGDFIILGVPTSVFLLLFFSVDNSNLKFLTPYCYFAIKYLYFWHPYVVSVNFPFKLLCRGWESPWACEQCSLEDLWSVGSFQENLDLHTSFGRFFEKNVGKYPKDGNTFPTKVDFPRKLKKFPKWTSSYNNISSKSHKIMVGRFCSLNNACWKF